MNNNVDGEQEPLSNKECQKGESMQMVPHSTLMRYASPSDRLLMYIGGLAAFINGASYPALSIIFGEMTDSFGGNNSKDELVEQAGFNALLFFFVGLGSFLLSFVQMSTWMIAGERQSVMIRKNYFGAILRQEIGWFDTNNPNELSSKVANECFSMQNAIGEKVPTFIFTMSCSLLGFLVGFIYGWQLALVITASFPALMISATMMTVAMQQGLNASSASYQNAGGIAEEVPHHSSLSLSLWAKSRPSSCSTARTTRPKGTPHTSTKLCGEPSSSVASPGSPSASSGASCSGPTHSPSGTAPSSSPTKYSLPSPILKTYNHNLGKEYTAGTILIIFFSIITGAFSLGQGGPCVQNFVEGRMAGFKAFAIIDRTPKTIENFQGQISYSEVSFTYPNKPETQVIKNITIEIPAGKKVAFVGESGCGKSTLVQLLERFYDCDQGTISIDGVKISDMNFHYLRSHIGYVGQEPVLFATSIRENLQYGKPDATEEEMIAVLKEVNAWEFIEKLENKLDTYVGVGGGQMSGGQKQRIAIARAIIKRPKVLLLDEATSALDKTNERLIQQTLDEVSKGITSIVIAHRLSTIQNCDIIFVIDKGELVEQGTHNELMAKKGRYEELAKSQFSQKEEEKEEEKEMEEKEQEKKQEAAKIQEPSGERPMSKQSSIKDGIAQELRSNAENMAKSIKEGYHQLQEVTPSNKKKKNSKVQSLSQAELDEEKKRQKDKEKEEAKKLQERDSQISSRLFAYNSPEKCLMFFGMFIALGNGTIFPIFSLFLADMISVLLRINPAFYKDSPQLYESLKKEIKDEANRITLWFFILGIIITVLWMLQVVLFAYIGEKLTFRIRRDTFSKLLKLPVSFFDKPENNAGTLASRLSVDCKSINGLTSNVIALNLMNMSAFITGLVIAFYYSWRVTLVTLGASPLLFISTVIQVNFQQGFSSQNDEAYKDSGNLIMEAVTNSRTVYSFSNQEMIFAVKIKLYAKKVQTPLEIASKKGIIIGLAFGFSNLVMFVLYALVFYRTNIGAVFVREYDVGIMNMFAAFFAILFSTMGGGNNQALTGDVGAAQNSARYIFDILDAEDEYQEEDNRNSPKIQKQIEGHIEFKNVGFKYESRDHSLFQDLNLTIEAKQKVALVGPSGCGKSTVIQLIQRFYQPQSGEIILDGENILNYDLRHLRKQLGVVSQEPVLFNGTIKENIKYNLDITDDQIRDAADKANALQFIEQNQFEDNADKEEQAKMGQGFDRKVGPKGSQISGGQKQRVAIARSIVRDCNLLLLDEATSALDSNTEELVQASLNRLMENKTTVTVAHRISTIKDSNVIYVFENGKIVEQGTYGELVSKKNVFYKLEQGIME